MAKKTFTGNPAMQFITPQEPAEEEAPIRAREPKPKAASKKDLPPEGYKLNPKYVEVKSRRLQLVMQPSLYEKVKARAKAGGLSVNEYIHEILDRETRED